MRRLPDSDTAPSPTEKLLEHIVLRWRATCGGLPLRAVVFSEGDPNHSHANAAAFASQHGGWVVQGWLVEQPRNWPMVYISSHSVVRLPSEELVDPTLPPHQLQGLGFVEHDPELVPFEDVRDRIRRRTAPLR